MDKIKKRKIFVAINAIILLAILGFYATRTIYYYKLEHPKTKDKDTLVSAILNNNGVAFAGSGLYKEEDNYYFKGSNVNNYVWYSGRLWEVISINQNNEVKMITSDSATSLVFNKKGDYQTSYVRNWLNNTNTDHSGIFLNTLNDIETYLKKSEWCYDEVALDNLTCNNKVEDYLGLITIEEYIKAGGQNSFLNNNTYWWTNNTSSNNKVWYIFNEGGINNESYSDVSYYSYGVRPVTVLNPDITAYSGTGTKEEPFIIEKNDNTLLNSKSVGDYISFSNQSWRILEQTKDYTKIVLDGYIQKDGADLEMAYSTKASLFSLDSTLGKYLNNTFYNTLNKESLIKGKFYIGNYGASTSYNYNSIYSKSISAYVGLLNVTDVLNGEYNNYWLMNNVTNNEQLVYKVASHGLYADLVTSNNKIRPVVCLKQNLTISTGNGTKNNPYLIEEA